MTELIRTVGGVETRFQCKPEEAKALEGDPRFKPAESKPAAPKKWGKPAAPIKEDQEADSGD